MSSPDPAAASASASASGPRLRLSVPAMSHVQIGPEELGPLLAEGGAAPLQGWGATTVLDVRGSDYVGGHVRGSVHVPFGELEQSGEGFDGVLSSMAAAGTRRLVVLDNSRQEAPVAAESILSKFKEAHPAAEEPVVYVLTSGFPGLLALHVDVAADRSSINLRESGAASIIADFDPAAWTAVAVPRTPSNASMPSSANVIVHKSSLDSAQRIVGTPKEA